MSDAHEKAVERLAKAIHWTQDGVLPRADHIEGYLDAADDAAQVTDADRESVRALLREIGLVAVDPALVEAVREARKASTPCAGDDGDHDPLCGECYETQLAEQALADSVLEQLGGRQ